MLIWDGKKIVDKNEQQIKPQTVEKPVAKSVEEKVEKPKKSRK